MLIKNWKLFQLTDSTHEAPHHLWRNHWRWWVWNASGKREYARNARVGETWTHWIFAQTSCLLECAWFPSSFPLLSRLILVFHPECLLLLKRPLREHLMCRREFALGLGSRPLSLLCSLGRRYFLYTVRMACSGFHLLFASSCHKLTVDVHIWKAPGHTATWIDGCSMLCWGGGCGEVLTACQSRLWRLARCPREEWPV